MQDPELLPHGKVSCLSWAEVSQMELRAPSTAQQALLCPPKGVDEVVNFDGSRSIGIFWSPYDGEVKQRFPLRPRSARVQLRLLAQATQSIGEKVSIRALSRYPWHMKLFPVLFLLVLSAAAAFGDPPNPIPHRPTRPPIHLSR
jgi:hypothetical protein